VVQFPKDGHERKYPIAFPKTEKVVMSVYWRDVKRGQNLVIDDNLGSEEVVGGYRETKRGIDAYARTTGYDPERSQKGFSTVEDAKAFVESFRPWELFGAHDITVDLEAKPQLD
jgi:hypothetical protein